jgi:hypothetical protein
MDLKWIVWIKMDCLFSLSGPSLSILPGLARLPRLPLFLAAFGYVVFTTCQFICIIC